DAAQSSYGGVRLLVRWFVVEKGTCKTVSLFHFVSCALVSSLLVLCAVW
ncbi:hypothetical protein A2U01_0083486, partial [Trifolium medium]|nr:hypothetical protein [Trifolium medium]